MDYRRPRGDITTVLDYTERDAQDGLLFPLDTSGSWFHRSTNQTTYPGTTVYQEFPHKGTAEWGGRFVFDIGNFQAGDLLNSVILQIRLGHWYDPITISKMESGEYTVVENPDPLTGATPPWTYIDSLGTAIIDYAEFEVGDQTLERIDGEFIRSYFNMYPDINMQFGPAADAIGYAPIGYLATNSGLFNPNRPWPIDRGIYTCILPFFFSRVRLQEYFPLLSCSSGNVRIIVQLRPFCDMVRSITGQRCTCTDTPLSQTVRFSVSGGGHVNVATSTTEPAFQDFRIVTVGTLLSDSVRQTYMRTPFEQMFKLVQGFKFTEPLTFLVSKTDSNTDTIDIQLPLELNQPVQDIFWVFRRKAAAINNEWALFAPFVETQYSPERGFPEWLAKATLRVNGFVVDQAPGEWWRWHFARSHVGAYTPWATYIYGYCFARNPDVHQPSGTANMSRAQTVTLRLSVNVPIAVSAPSGFDESVEQGWEVYVYALYCNWIRFENGICNRIFNT